MSEVPCKKRDDYLEWPEYFMAVAFLAAQRSKDPNSQVGACIVNAENKIVGIGYNGMPNGCSDDHLPWERTAASKLDTKYPYDSHRPSAARPLSGHGPDSVPKEDLSYKITNVINGEPLSKFTLERNKDYFYESRDKLRFHCVML
ncbi:deoxycytidylate deaminase isoform X4 [Canis lupus baileyi]|uniref:deoxycytidylate deaminase isoform X3 n=1 Tax=Canis lupus dingo TaxID=286419 RepID=UPI000DC6793A|nr:deoxycytidylate deaminase isoform X3 [Canis lupus dingo]XP_038318763.1 deoxycytidylate deaminase isoform X4 [Canis lupus familiaris]